MRLRRDLETTTQTMHSLGRENQKLRQRLHDDARLYPAKIGFAGTATTGPEEMLLQLHADGDDSKELESIQLLDVLGDRVCITLPATDKMRLISRWKHVLFQVATTLDKYQKTME
ncbi:hypothetical protein BKA81DRAFT_402090 [Phyllosticta paracitricarpa]